MIVYVIKIMLQRPAMGAGWIKLITNSGILF